MLVLVFSIDLLTKTQTSFILLTLALIHVRNSKFKETKYLRQKYKSDQSGWSSVSPSPTASDGSLCSDGLLCCWSVSFGSGVWAGGSWSQTSSDSSVWEGLQSNVNSDWSSVNEGLSWSTKSDFVTSPRLFSNCKCALSVKLTVTSLYERSVFFAPLGGLGSRGKDRPLWRIHSLCSSVTSDTFVLFPLSRKLARGGRTFTPVTVTDPSMALRNYEDRNGTVNTAKTTKNNLIKDIYRT